MGRGVAGEQPRSEGPGGAGQQQAQRQPAACPGRPEGKPHPGVHQTQRGQETELSRCIRRWCSLTWSLSSAVLGPTIEEEREGP